MWWMSAHDEQISGRKHLRLRQGDGAALSPIDEMASQSEVVVEAGMDEGESATFLHPANLYIAYNPRNFRAEYRPSVEISITTQHMQQDCF